MQFKGSIIISVIALVILFAFSDVTAESLQVMENSGNDVPVPPSLLERQQMILLGFLMPRVTAGSAGAMAIYDDPKIKRIGDYAEVYNSTGNLIAIVWFDKFGIMRSAIDRGIVLYEHTVEGVMVLVLEGEVL